MGVWCAHGDRVSHVQVTPDGMALGSASWDKTMKVWWGCDQSCHV